MCIFSVSFFPYPCTSTLLTLKSTFQCPDSHILVLTFLGSQGTKDAICVSISLRLLDLTPFHLSPLHCFFLSLFCLLWVFGYEYYKPSLAAVEVKIGGGREGTERDRSEGRSSSWAGESSFQSRAVNRITLYLGLFFFSFLYEQILAVLGTQQKWATI